MRKDKEKRRQYQREYQRKLRTKHPQLARERSQKYRDKNRAYARERQRRLHGLPAPTRPEPEWCECCGRLFEKTPHLDHDHRTGKFRGWICGPCNHALGLFGDTLEGVAKAFAYLGRAQ